MKQHILLLGVGQDQLPMIKNVFKLGWGAIGFDGNPNAVGKEFVNYFECLDIRNPDLVEEKALYYNKKIGIDAVMAPATEMGISCGRVVDRLGLIGIGEKTAEKLTDKVWRRSLFDKLKINQPKWAISKEPWDIFPCIIKPRNQMAAVGVRYIQNKEELLKQQDYDIIEEYLEGWEISTEALVFPDQRVFTAHADRNYKNKLKYKPYVIEDGCSYPSIINQFIKFKINNIVRKIVYELNLRSCALKLDLLVKDNLVYVIECAPRLGGGKLSSVMIPGVDSFDWWGIDLLLACGYPLGMIREPLHVGRPNGSVCVQRYKFPAVVTSHKDRLYSVECFGSTYQEALEKAEKEVKNNGE